MNIANAVLAIAFTLAVSAAHAQPPSEPQRPPLREDLRIAGQHLMEHPHPYTMSEEVARVRLQKQGLNPTEIRPLDQNRFEAQVLSNGLPMKVEINRLNGAVRPTQ
jgi:hypothetical protein